MEAKDYVEILLKLGYTQGQIATLIGKNQGDISKIKRGGVEDVMSKTYRKLQGLAARAMAGEKLTADRVEA